MKKIIGLLFFLYALFPCRLSALDETLPYVKVFAKKIFKDAGKIEKNQSGIWYSVYGRNGKLLGKVIVSYGIADGIKGYVGEVPVIAAIDEKSEKIVGIDFLPNKETEGFLEYINKKGFLKQFIGLEWRKVPNEKFETVTGATITTKAFINTLKKMFEEARKKECQKK